jgi:D-serine deaminase-like pyridoxal phosphate-dependent protein
MNGFGEIIGKPGALVTGLSEEHGVVTLGDGATSMSANVFASCQIIAASSASVRSGLFHLRRHGR